MQEHQINLPSGENGIDLLVSVSVLGITRSFNKKPTSETCHIALYRSKKNRVILKKV